MEKKQEIQSIEPDEDSPISEAEKRAAVDRILVSSTFSKSPRLCDFLHYVTDESILGRGESIRAKSIASSVYERDTVEGMTSANVVRVEARRLRRRLQDYYETEGRTDTVRVHIDKGGYIPRFSRHTPDAKKQQEGDSAAGQKQWLRPRPGKASMVVGIIGISLLVTTLILTGVIREQTETDSTQIEREALMEQSPAALEAENLVTQARGLIYPIFDFNRQRLTTELFRSAIETDANSAGAHAGAAQTLASLALLSVEGPQHDAYLEEARQLLERALTLAPTDSWTQSAAGWVAFVARDYDNAMRYSERALRLAPKDGNVLDFYGVVAIFTGEYEKAALAADPQREREGPNTRFANLNILAAARFHQGNFDETARLFEESNVGGGPLSAPGVVYLAAAYQGMGRIDEGQRMVRLLEDSWPAFPPEKVLLRLHQDEKAAQDVINRLRALGWSD